MLEKRKHKRIKLGEHPVIYDATSNKLIGTMIDISSGGFKVVSYSGMEIDKDYLLKIILPNRDGNEKSFVAKVNIRWCEKGTTSSFFTIGCLLTEVKEGALNLSSFMMNIAT
ncbi:MAG: hypothetical protein GQ468_00680 [Candidatus Scalindua sp.]|nr:hypothetical protein [Candidatus Scalindua sp.]